MWDWVLFILLLTPYRCTQCLRRFYRFRSNGVRRIVTVTLCLIPVIVLIAWFLELNALNKGRSATAPEPAKADSFPSQKDIQRILDQR